MRERYADANVKANEFLFRRLDIEDAVSAHLLAAERAPDIGFRRYIVRATTPFAPEHLATLRSAAPTVVRRLVPEHDAAYAARGWHLFSAVDRVYVTARARAGLGWRPPHDFAPVRAPISPRQPPKSPLAHPPGPNGHHA